MSYLYRPSGKPGMMDLLKVTKKGINAGLPAGYVMPIGYLYGEKEAAINLQIILRENKYPFQYTVKHCENENEMTHITQLGVLNRFGLFYASHKIEFGNDVYSTLDIGSGWFKRISIEPTEEAFAKL